MNKKVIFVHGFNSSPKRDWYPKISVELKKLGIDYAIPRFPAFLFPKLEKWLVILNNAISESKKPVILVGHSLGTRAILEYLNRTNRKIDSVILVSAFDNNFAPKKRWFGRLIKNFFEKPVDLVKIKNQVKNFYILHSKDDYRIDYHEAENLAQNLNAKLITFEDRGHFYEEENFRYVLPIIKKLSKN